MSSPPANEPDRQQAVDRSGAIRLRGDRALIRISDAAAQDYGMPISAISIISQDRQLLLARTGLELWETSRGESFCAIAIHRPGEPLVIADALEDRRLRQHPSVRFAPFVRFYAGIPIVDRGGYALGALCIADTKPHDASINLTNLMMLAHEVERLVVQ